MTARRFAALQRARRRRARAAVDAAHALRREQIEMARRKASRLPR